MPGVHVGVGDVAGIGVRPRPGGRPGSRPAPGRGPAPELLPDVESAGRHGFPAQRPVAVPAADEHDRDLGAPVVQQVRRTGPPRLSHCASSQTSARNRSARTFLNRAWNSVGRLGGVPPTARAWNSTWRMSRGVGRPGTAPGAPLPGPGPAVRRSPTEGFAQPRVAIPHIIAFAAITSAKLSRRVSRDSVAATLAPGSPRYGRRVRRNPPRRSSCATLRVSPPPTAAVVRVGPAVGLGSRQDPSRGGRPNGTSLRRAWASELIVARRRRAPRRPARTVSAVIGWSGAAVVAAA